MSSSTIDSHDSCMMLEFVDSVHLYLRWSIQCLPNFLCLNQQTEEMFWQLKNWDCDDSLHTSNLEKLVMCVCVCV